MTEPRTDTALGLPVHADPIERFLDLVIETHWQDLPPAAVDAARVFFMDTVGVAVAGRLAPMLAQLCEVAQGWSGVPGAGVTIWNTGLRAPAPVAALVNGYQCHALEYDCVYEPGVILPTPPVFAALMGKAQQLAEAGRPPSGRDLLRAFAVAIEVSCTLGAATRSGMFFFRPATTGTFSALAALACLDPLPREQLRYAFGIAYSQACGSMQAHEEGSMMLAMQMGFAARNAVQAHDMARVGITAPVQVLGGRFGFFHNYEREHALEEELPRIGAPWKVTQLSHKPFPSGRVTHGVIHAMRQLRRELQIGPADALQRIAGIDVTLPPLGKRLVGRPMVHHPKPNYARLCIPYVAAAEVFFGQVDPTTFTSHHLESAEVEALALRVTTTEVPHPNPNAFFPQTLVLRLTDGRRITREIPHAWGHPAMPLSPQEREDKFRLCWRLKHGSSAPERLEQTIDWLNALEVALDLRPLFDLLDET